MRTPSTAAAVLRRRILPEYVAPPSPPPSPVKHSVVHSRVTIVAVTLIAFIAAAAAVFLAVFLLRRHHRKNCRLPPSDPSKPQGSNDGGAIPSEQESKPYRPSEKSLEFRSLGTLARAYAAGIFATVDTSTTGGNKCNFPSNIKSKAPPELSLPPPQPPTTTPNVSRRSSENDYEAVPMEDSINDARQTVIHPDSFQDPDPAAGTDSSSVRFGSSNLPVCNEIELSRSPPLHSVSPARSNVSDEIVESPAKINSSIHHRTTVAPSSPGIEVVARLESSIPLALYSSSPDRPQRSSENSSSRNATVSDESVEYTTRIESPVRRSAGSPETGIVVHPKSGSAKSEEPPPKNLEPQLPERWWTSSRNSDDSDQITTSPTRIETPTAAVTPKAYETESASETTMEECPTAFLNENAEAESSPRIRIRVQQDSAIVVPPPPPANHLRGPRIQAPGAKPSVRPRALLETRARIRPRALPSDD